MHEARNGEKIKRQTTTLPASKDWRQTPGMVQAIKNQGQCGSCWAFSTVASLEGQYFKKYNKSVAFSEQDLTDCVYGTAGGCNGGWMATAFAYIKSTGGIDTMASYPVESLKSNLFVSLFFFTQERLISLIYI